MHVLGERAETVLLPEPLVPVHKIAAAAPHRGKEAWFMSCVSKHGHSTFPWAAGSDKGERVGRGGGGRQQVVPR